MKRINGTNYYSTKEIAETLGCSRGTVVRYFHEGKIKYYLKPTLGTKTAFLVSEDERERLLNLIRINLPIRKEE